MNDLRGSLRRAASCAWPILVVSSVLAGCAREEGRPLQGYVEGEYVRVAAPFAGTLQALAVRRGEQVAAGAVVFALESENEAAARREAEARVRAAQSRLANLQTGKRPAEVRTVAAQLEQARAARDLSATNLKRQQELFRSGFVSGAVLDDARTRLKRDDAQVEELQAMLQTTRLPARTDEIRAAEAEVTAARDALAQVEWRLGQRTVEAPIAGLVHDTYYVVGDFVPAGSPVAAILPAANLKARFYVPETVVGRLAIGGRVDLACDGCGAPIPATISFVSDRAEFTPPVLYSKENRAKLVFLVEARPAPADAIRLKPGQPLDVTLPAS